MCNPCPTDHAFPPYHACVVPPFLFRFVSRLLPCSWRSPQYFVEGVYTPELRTKLKHECHDRICGWKEQFECSKGTPCTCNGPEDVIGIPTKLVSAI